MKNRKKELSIAIILLPILLCMTVLGVDRAIAGIYSIHFASYKTVSQAEMDINRLRSQGYDAFFIETPVPKSGKWYRVYAGKYETRKKAASAAADMKSKQQIDKVFIHLLPGISSGPAEKIPPQAQSPQPASSKAAVVGNSTSKRYHLPGMPFYGKVKKYHRVLFASEQEAIDKGYYKAGSGPDGEEEKAAKNPPVRQAASKKSTSLGREPDPVASGDVGKDKEVFEALIRGNQKLIPDPLKIMKTGPAQEMVFKDPDELEIVEPVSDSVLYNKALGQLKEKKYEQALVTFKEFISRDDTSKVWGQRALRHMADCHYYLGIHGRKENLLIATEFYKNTLESFPDPRKENALTYYRLAKTYEHLKYYPEAIKNYQNLIVKYPDAPYVPEAYFKIGDLYYVDGKYNQAADQLIRYLMKYRSEAHAQKTFYMIAHAFYKGKQSTNAEVWFREAQKKWPDFKDVPKEILIDYGMHKMSLRRFDEAISGFSFYVNLYPNDENIKEVLLLLAGAYESIGQFSPALAVYKRVIDVYPGTKEEGRSILSMASLGVDKPGIKAFRSLNNIHYYREPMNTYDSLIMKNATGDLGEEAMLQKAVALVKKGQGRKAADVYLEFIRLHPESKRVAEAAKGLKTASAALIDEYYAKKDYLAVAYVYFKSYGAVALLSDEYPQVSKIALSLKELGFMDDYASILKRYLKVATDEAIINKASLDIADGLIIQGKYDEVQKVVDALAVKPSVKNSALMTRIRKSQAEIAYRKERYDQAVVNYDAVVRSGQEFSDPGRTYANYARSLKEQKDNAQALQNYLTAVQYLGAEKREKENAGIAYKEIGDLYLKNNNLAGGLNMYNQALASATDTELKRWSQFLVGKTYLRMNKDDQAQNTFTQMKTAAGPEGFWTKVVDFYVADYQWWEKYGNLVDKK